MSKILDELKCLANRCLFYAYNEDGCGTHNRHQVADFLAKIDSLGENARRMLEIGIMQDEIVKLGLEKYSSILSGMGKFRFASEKLYISVRFYIDFVTINNHEYDFYYNSPTCQQDLLTKVKELINHE